MKTIENLQRYSPVISHGMQEDPEGNYVFAHDLEQLFTTTRVTERAEYAALPVASFPEVDAYIARATEFVKMTSKGFQQVASLTTTAVATHMAFLDGKRLP